MILYDVPNDKTVRILVNRTSCTLLSVLGKPLRSKCEHLCRLWAVTFATKIGNFIDVRQEYMFGLSIVCLKVRFYFLVGHNNQGFDSDWSAAIEGETTLSAQCIATATFMVSSGLKE